MTSARTIGSMPLCSAVETLRWVRANEHELRVLKIGAGSPVGAMSLAAALRERTTARFDRFPAGCPLDRMATRVAQERLGRGVRHLSLFLSPAGGSTPAHYDANDVLVFQIRGAKRLVVDDRPLVRDPMEDALVSDWVPDATEAFDLRRGDAVLIPRGHVHATASTMGSLTLGIGLFD